MRLKGHRYSRFALSGACVFTVLVLHGQCNQDTYRWVFDGAGDESSHRVVSHANGDVYAAGYGDGYGADNDFLLVRLNAVGDLVWAKRFDVVGDDGGMSMYLATGPSGSLYLGGTMAGVATSQEDGSLVKLDADGNVIWARRILPVPFYCQVRAMAERPDGDLIVVGSVNSIGAGNADSYAARFDLNGNLLWLKSYGWSGQDHFTHIELLADGSFLACSQSMGSPSTNRKAYIAHIAADGNPISCVLHNGGVLDTYNHGVANPDGTYLWVGFTESYGAGGRDVLAVLTDSSGNLIWSRTYGTVGNEEGLNPVLDAAGGWRISAFQGPTREAHVLHVLPNGDLNEVRTVPGVQVPSSALWAQLLEPAVDGGLYFVGGDGGVGGGGLVIQKLDACAEQACPSQLAGWLMAAPVIPQVNPVLPVSATSTNVVSVVVSAFDISGQFEQGIDMIDCDTCTVALGQAAMQACLGATVTLAPSINTANPTGLAWHWDLGDGSFSLDDTSVTHVYQLVGDYSVELIVSDTIGGCADTLEFSVTVDDVADPFLGNDVTECEGVVVELTPGDSGGAVILWSDGSSGTSLMPQQSGIYWVVFEQGACQSTDTVLVDFIAPPALLAASDTTICLGTAVTVSTEPGWTGWQWSDGSAAEAITITESGVFVVQASWGGCPGIDSLSVSVLIPQPVNLGPDISACSGSELVLATGLTGEQHLWSDGSTADSLVVDSSGSFWVEVGMLGCSSSDTVLVSIVATPVVALGPDLLLCDGADVLLGPVTGSLVNWSTGDSAPSLVVDSAGTYFVIVEDQGCWGSDTIVVAVGVSPQVGLPADTVACGIGSVEIVPLLVADAVSWEWSTGEQLSSIDVETGGTYWLTVTNTCGNASDTIEVLLNTALEVDLGPDLVLCGDDSALIGSGFDSTLTLWNDTWFGDTLLVTAPGSYWVSVSSGGCMGADTLVIDWAPLPVIVLPEDTVLCGSGNLLVEVLQALGDQIVWSTGDTGMSITTAVSGLITATAINVCGSSSDSMLVIRPESMQGDSLVQICWGDRVQLSLPAEYSEVLWQHGITEPSFEAPVGNYSWMALDGFRCPRIGRFIVEVDSLTDGMVFVPNVFTPNGDGVNDRFRAIGVDNGAFSIDIFNRWGEAIWSTEDPADSWDGGYGGLPVPDGTYVYLLRHQVHCSENEGRRERIGHVTLLR